MRKGEQTQKLKVHTESLVATPRAYRAILETVDLALSFKNDSYGVDIDTIMNNLAIKIPLQQVKNTVEELINEGHIYTTIDDNHYQTVD
ncbi:hypothetical protein M8J77_012367 [Diaphorina citri]|nr:hypothetical protein M8J77_012367 [Diaphorina citri]